MIDRNPADFLTGKLEDLESFKATPEFKQWLVCFADHFDRTRSEFVREAIINYATFLQICPELRGISVQRLRSKPDHVRKILVLLEEV